MSRTSPSYRFLTVAARLSRRSRVLSARIVVATAAILLAPAGVCRAQPQPQPGTAVTGSAYSLVGTGLRVTVDNRFLDNPGYRPFRITVTPTTPVTADRTLTVQLVFRKRLRQERILRVDRDIEIPAGSGPIETVISVPQVDYWDSYDFRVSEDGTFLPALSRQMLMASQRGYVDRADVEAMPRLLVVGDALPDTSKLAMNLPELSQVQMSMVGAPMGMAGMGAPVAASNPLRAPSPTPMGVPVPMPNPPLPTAMFAAPADLSENWIDYTSLDIICLSIDELAALATSRPGAFRAILAWTSAGGNLWVYGVEGENDRWQRLPELTALVGLPPAEEHDTTRQGWTKPEEAELERAQAEARAQAQEEPDLAEAFGARGMTSSQAREMLQAMAAAKKASAPPPGRRRKRLHLLVLTIPASAVLVTVLLFGYAIVADGLGTRIRARSVTHLDQRRGHAACWARLSYYAGVAPSGGLTFSDDVAVLPFVFDPVSQSGWRSVEQAMSWDDDQHFKRGWLASRTPTQFLTLRSRPSKLRLAIDDTRRASDELVIENLLDAPIEQLAVRTADGKYYWATDVDRGGTARAKRTEASEAVSSLRKCLADNQPGFPPGMDRQSSSGVFGLRGGRRYYMMYGGNRSESPTQGTSRLERSLQDPAMSGGGRPLLAPGTYVAIVRESPEVELGTDSALEEASFHVILGEW
ncbi:MAG: hypothetical protein NTW96_16930 [Planctomycetia bacterium]|nr:hypothetical protein [Planctomycetia bacterium]